MLTALVALLLGALYWFKFRDDGSWDKNAKVDLRPVDYTMKTLAGMKGAEVCSSCFHPFKPSAVRHAIK